MTAAAVAEGLREACDIAVDELAPGPIRERLRDARARLDEPPRVVVAGVIKAGKSTVVNALLGRVVATTDAGEATRVVAWYRLGHQERATVTLRSGTVTDLALPGGRLPERIDAAADDVDHLTVWLNQDDPLGRRSLVDTPGQRSASNEVDARTVDAMAEADLLLYLFRRPDEHDLALLAGLDRLRPGAPTAALNVVGILTGVDLTAGGRDDPWPTAHAEAARYRAELAPYVSDVVPVIGLLAETAVGALTEREATDLVELARLDAGEVERRLLAAEVFVRWDAAPIGRDRRELLLGRLGLHGLRLAVPWAREPGATAQVLQTRLWEESGFAALQQVVDRAAMSHAEVSQVARQLHEVSRMAHLGGREDEAPLRVLRDRLDELADDPALHLVREARARRAVGRGDVTMPDGFGAALVSVLSDAAPAARLGLDAAAGPERLAEAVTAQTAVWTEAAASPLSSSSFGHLTRTVVRSLGLIAEAQEHDHG